jgi:hypothetical protein
VRFPLIEAIMSSASRTHLLDGGFNRPNVFDAVGLTASVREAFDLLEKSPVSIRPRTTRNPSPADRYSVGA